MKFSAKCRYGLRAMYVLGENYGESLSIAQISESCGVPEPYLEKIMASLKRGGFITSSRGAQGGYGLAYPPEYITIAQILKVLDKHLFESECITGGCKNMLCPNKNVFGAIYDNINKLLESMTLKEIISKENKK